MNKIKNMALAALAVCIAAGFTACSKDEKIVEKIVEKEVPVEVIVEKEKPVVQDNNWSRYQALVTDNVKQNKKHDKAILLVAFGSTWEQAFNAFDTTIEAYKQAFPNYDIFLSYSSAICINRAAAGRERCDAQLLRAPLLAQRLCRQGCAVLRDCGAVAPGDSR